MGGLRSVRGMLWGVGCVAALIFVSCTCELFADGKFYPDRAYKAAPAIPSQRAILAYRDGIEKLTIESSLEGEGKQFGWIIPLPSVPTEFEKASPGLIKTLSLVVQPKITHDIRQSLSKWRLLAVVFTAAYVLLMLVAPRRRIDPVVLIVLAVPAAYFMMPALQRPGLKDTGVATFGADVTVHSLQEIGNYELAVLEASTPEALGRWLADNGFVSLDEKDGEIVADYTNEGWCFVAAKLTRDGDGFSRPHPLSMTFPCKEPVYPMRLTPTAGNDVYVELFVVAEKRARADHLKLEVADRFVPHKAWIDREENEYFVNGLVGRSFRQRVLHSSVMEEMWDGCMLSKLCGTLKPGQMEKDIDVKLVKAGPHIQHYYSNRGALDTGKKYGLVTWCVVPWLLFMYFQKKMPKDDRRRYCLKRVLGPSAALSVIVLGMIYGAAPRVHVEVDRVGGLGRHMQQKLRDLVVLQIAREIGTDGLTVDEFREVIDEFFQCHICRNSYSGEQVKHEDSPGNYNVVESDWEVVYRSYMESGYWTDRKIDDSPIGRRNDSADTWLQRRMRALQQIDPNNPEYDLISAINGRPYSIKGSSNDTITLAKLKTDEFSLATMLVELYLKRPVELIPVVIGDIRRRMQGHRDHIAELEHEVGMLGCITHMEPPFDVTDGERVEQFLREVEAWGAEPR